MRIVLRPVVLALTLLAVGCGSDPTPTPATPAGCEGATLDTYAPGLIKATAGGRFNIELVSSSLVPPDRGDNMFVLRALDAAGRVVSDAGVTIRPWMPNHGHGSTPESFTPRTTAVAGDLEVGPINFFMPGLWELRVDVTSATVQSAERATFAFCVEG